MRTDVKIGLICVVALALGGVIFLVGRGNAHPQGARGSTPTSTDSKTAEKSSASASPASASPAAPASGGVVVAAPAPTTPFALDKQLAAGPSAPGSGMAGQMIAPPGSPSDRIGAAPGATTMPAGASPSGSFVGGTPGVPGLTGGTPSSVSPSSPAGGISSSPPGAGGRSILPRSQTSAPDSRETINFGGEPTSPRESSPAAPSGSSATPGRWAGPSTIGAAGGGSTGVGPGRTGSAATPTTHVPPGGTTYTIEKGDMLGPIATKFGVTVKAIEAANPGINPNNLKVKSTIAIPAATPKSEDTHADTHATASTKPAAKPASHATAGGKSSTIKPGSDYTVKKGDTLGSIAQAAYGDKGAWKRIFRANRSDLEDPDVVPVGTVLRLPG